MQENIKIAPYTTFKIGGLAKFFVVAQNSDELVEAVKWAKNKGEKYFVLGGGSNVLFDDNGYNGLVIKVENVGIQNLESKRYKVESGVLLSSVVLFANKNGYSDLEWAFGLPGTVGGAVRGNAGAYGGSISEVVEEVKIFDGESVRVLKKDELDFEYRSSIFKKNNFLILSIILKFSKVTDKQKINKKTALKRSIDQPKGLSSGSIFKNPDNDYAGRLIDECGLKGRQIGDAKISDLHANFVINTGSATSKNILDLIQLVKKDVYDKFKIKLQEEIEVVEF